MKETASTKETANTPATATIISAGADNLLSPADPIPSPDHPAVPAPVTELVRVFRRKPLLVHAVQVHSPGEHNGVAVFPGDWIVTEAGRTFVVKKVEFNGLYEAVDTDAAGAVDAGLADLDPGTYIDKDGKRMVRVTVMSGRGNIAYWAKALPTGELAGWRVVADMTDNPGASHRAGKFVEAFEGKPGQKTWVVVG